MKLAFLYAGQGSQKVGMGQDLYDAHPEICHIFDSSAAGFSIKDTCFSGPIETLSLTRYTQPCMAAFAAAVTDLLRGRGIEPDFAAGLSLGEYSALYAAGVFSAEQLIDTVAFRGRVMEETTAGIDAAMYAILGLSPELTEKAVSEARENGKGLVACANFNCPGQIVIGGERAAAELAAEKCKEFGAKRAMPLNVSGPFHTGLMQAASELLEEKLGGMELGEPRLPVVFNATADRAGAADIKELLRQQVKSPVLFEKSILMLRSLGVDTVIEIGPGKVLSGFVKKTAPDIKCYAVEDCESLEAAVKAL